MGGIQDLLRGLGGGEPEEERRRREEQEAKRAAAVKGQASLQQSAPERVDPNSRWSQEIGGERAAQQQVQQRQKQAGAALNQLIQKFDAMTGGDPSLVPDFMAQVPPDQREQLEQLLQQRQQQ